jgi:hypothetical protein
MQGQFQTIWLREARTRRAISCDAFGNHGT